MFSWYFIKTHAPGTYTSSPKAHASIHITYTTLHRHHFWMCNWVNLLHPECGCFHDVKRDWCCNGIMRNQWCAHPGFTKRVDHDAGPRCPNHQREYEERLNQDRVRDRVRRRQLLDPGNSASYDLNQLRHSYRPPPLPDSDWYLGRGRDRRAGLPDPGNSTTYDLSAQWSSRRPQPPQNSDWDRDRRAPLLDPGSSTTSGMNQQRPSRRTPLPGGPDLVRDPDRDRHRRVADLGDFFSSDLNQQRSSRRPPPPGGYR